MTLNMIMRTPSARCSLSSSVLALRTCAEFAQKRGEVGDAQCPAVEVAESCDVIDRSEPLFDLMVLRDRRIEAGSQHLQDICTRALALPLGDGLLVAAPQGRKALQF